MVTAVEYDVKKLKRIRVENIMLGDLEEGQWRKFTEKEVEDVLKRIHE
jgi:23S rRNA pseudouridine2604 synthase